MRQRAFVCKENAIENKAASSFEAGSIVAQREPVRDERWFRSEVSLLKRRKYYQFDGQPSLYHL